MAQNKLNLLQSHFFAARFQYDKEKAYEVSEQDDLWLNYDKFACNHICVKDVNELKEVNIADLKLGINYGVKLVATTRMDPRGLMNVTTILEDKNEDIISCAIYNYTQIMQISVDKLNPTLPINTTLIIKEPYIKIFQNQTPAIRIDNSHINIVLFNKKTIHFDNESMDTLNITELKEHGNKYYKMKQYDVAIKYYSTALAKQDQDQKYQDLIGKLLNNRALCYVQLKEFQKAAQDGLKALSMNESWLKARYTLCSALIGTKRYKQALDVLKGVNTNKNKAFKSMVKTIQTKIRETSKEFINDKPVTMQLWEPVTDFISDSIKLAWINNKKGRGFIATKDIKQGQLLVREKCFAVGYPVKNWRDYWLKKKQTQFNDDMFVTQDYVDENNKLIGVNQRSVGQYNLLCDLMKKYVNGADIDRYKVSLLYDGSNRKQIIPTMDVLKHNELPDDVKIEDIPILSARRLMQIVEKNCFHIPVESKGPCGGGLFIVSSLFNHSSKSNNCDNRAYPFKQIIFALRNIKKGEELTITYYNDFENKFLFNYDDP